MDRGLFAPLARAFEAGDVERAIDLSMSLWVDGPTRSSEENRTDIRRRVRTMYSDVLRRTQEPGFDATELDPPAITRLHEIRAPALVVVGTGDIPDIQDQASLLARSIPNAREVRMPRLAHVLNMERPAEVNRLILEFLAGSWGPDTIEG